MSDGRLVKQTGENTFEVTTYRGAPANDKQIAAAVAKLSMSFPAVKDEFFGVLCSRWRAEQWTAQRIADAVDNLVDNCRFPTFSIGQIMTFDKPMKLYTHGGYCWLISTGQAQDVDCCGEQSDFGKLTIDGKVFFYLKRDLPQNAQKRP